MLTAAMRSRGIRHGMSREPASCFGVHAVLGVKSSKGRALSIALRFDHVIAPSHRAPEPASVFVGAP
jgi:hypothetical protein